MKARALLAGAVLGPEALKVIGRAFDDAWEEIVHHFYGSPIETEQARVRLAHAVLAVSDDDVRDPEELKHLALQVMALRYPRRWYASPSASPPVDSPGRD